MTRRRRPEPEPDEPEARPTADVRYVDGVQHVTVYPETARAYAGTHPPTVISAGGTPFAVASNAFLSTDLLSASDLRRGAMEYNVGRAGVTLREPGTVQLPTPFLGTAEPVLVVPERPLSSSALRVCSVLMGAWVAHGSPECDPAYGVHAPDCPHRLGRQRHHKRDLSRATFGHDGGRQIRQLERALDELVDESTGFYLWDPERRAYAVRRSHILAYQEAGRLPEYARAGERSADAALEVRWDSFLLDSLLAGHYQSFPMEFVRRLYGTAFLVWLHVLLQPGTAELERAGDAREYAVTGRTATITPARLGLAGQARRPDKLRDSLEHAAEEGNALARTRLGLELTVEPRATGGLKLRLRRLVDRAELRRSEAETAALEDGDRGTRGRIARHLGTDSAALGDAVPVQNGSPRRASLDGGSRRASLDETETRDKSRTRDEAIAAAVAEGRPDIAALLERTGWRRVTSGVRRDLDALADRHDLTGYQWAADRIREAPECADPHGYMAAVYAAERAYKAERAAEAEAVERVQREREREARRRPVADEWDSAAASVPETVRETVASRRPDGSLPPPEPEPEAAAETPEETRARRIAAARAVLDASLSGYAADKARATLRELGEEP